MDFRRTRSEPNTVSIQGEEVEVDEEYRYLGVYLDSRLDWKCNIEAVFKKGHNRLCFLRKLMSFNVCTKMLHILYKPLVESAICSLQSSVGAATSDPDSKKLNKLIKKAGSVLGTALEPLELIVKRRMCCILDTCLGIFKLWGDNLFLAGRGLLTVKKRQHLDFGEVVQ